MDNTMEINHFRSVIMNNNKKSDVKAKNAFVSELMKRGFDDARIVAAPSDIIAIKDGETWYFEIKMTHRKDTCFGAATQTEWRQAFKDPDHFRFVLAMTSDDTEFTFKEFTPAEFMEFSTIPPFKVYFNIDLSGKKRKRHNSSRTCLKLTRKAFESLDRLYNDLKAAVTTDDA